MHKNILPIIIGPTASNKTRLAALLAHELHGEIISADSRQVYRGMDIGTGKDYEDYTVQNTCISYHLIDIVEAGETYNLFAFIHDFQTAYSDIVHRNNLPIVCGGTGMYVEAIIKNYNLHKVPEDAEFRKECETKTMDELRTLLASIKKMHNTSDIDSKKRVIRALEIARFEQNHELEHAHFSMNAQPIVLGIDISREERRKRIETRFLKRIESGMVHEVETLIQKGVSTDVLKYYGLEYKYITMYVLGEISKQQLEQELLIAIFQFAKRQMTWFRGMERRGIKIHWINGEQPMEERLAQAKNIILEYQK